MTNPEKVNCLLCNKELEYEPGPDHTGNVYDAGFMLISFHYGSRHDQCHGFDRRKSDRDDGDEKNKLLTCDEIEAFICDDCFEKKFDKMRGYDINRPRPKRERIV